MSADPELKRTPLYQVHLDRGAKMVPFAGYSMPVQFSEGIVKEHLHTRAAAGLFDVSHMGQLRLRGPQVAEALERIIPVDLQALGPNRQIYGVLTNDEGGILDDLIICRWGEEDFFLVVNAACKAADLAHLRGSLPGIDVDELNTRALLALQGPKAVDVLANLMPEAADLVFMSGCAGRMAEAECFVSRSGYTGEDGFEISVPEADAAGLARTLLAFEGVSPVGLGARDSLRLEAGLCLYGHDMDTTTTVVEAGLSWSVSKARREDGARAGGFPGAEVVLAQMKDGPPRRRVGIAVEGRAPVREGAVLQTPAGQAVGQVCSGGFSPSLQVPVAMGYVSSACTPLGTELKAMVRGKPRAVTVARLPFVPQRYFRRD